MLGTRDFNVPDEILDELIMSARRCERAAKTFDDDYLDANHIQHGFLATFAPVPEPATRLLLTISALGVISWMRGRLGRPGAVKVLDGLTGEVC